MYPLSGLKAIGLNARVFCVKGANSFPGAHNQILSFQGEKIQIEEQLEPKYQLNTLKRESTKNLSCSVCLKQ